MIISFAWTTDALLAGVKKVTRRDWSKEYAAKFRSGSVHSAWDKNPRIHGKQVGDVLLVLSPYPERTRDIPDHHYELEGFQYMEDRGLKVNGRTPREHFDAWRESNQVLFVLHFELAYCCDRCVKWTTKVTFGPRDDKRLCALCWMDWRYYSDSRSNRTRQSSDVWEELYNEFCATSRKAVSE